MKKFRLFLYSIVISVALIFSSNVFASEININTHPTQNRTKTEVIEKYMSCQPKYNYANSLYEVQPSFKSPYASGKLNKQVIADTLNQINLYRWLYGINEVSINESKMERNQKGAVILAANNKLTHYPEKPADMDESFYKEAYAGCNVGYTVKGDFYNGNCAWGDTAPTYSISDL